METTTTRLDRTQGRGEARSDLPARPRPERLPPSASVAMSPERVQALAWLTGQMLWEQRVDELRARAT